MRSQGLFPVLLLVGHLDELNIHAIPITLLSGLVIWERALDKRLSGVDISRRGSGPNLPQEKR